MGDCLGTDTSRTTSMSTPSAEALTGRLSAVMLGDIEPEEVWLQNKVITVRYKLRLCYILLQYRLLKWPPLSVKMSYKSTNFETKVIQNAKIPLLETPSNAKEPSTNHTRRMIKKKSE